MGVCDMHILMLCTKYPLETGDHFLTNELAAALVAAGHQVQVAVIEWGLPVGMASREVREENGVEVLVIAPTGVSMLGRFIKNLSKWTLSSIFGLRHMRRAIRNKRYDIVLCFTPCVTVAAQLLWATRRFRTRNMLIVHDFFPYHHHSIGVVPSGPLFRAALSLETHLMQRFHAFGCMSPRNIDYLRKNYLLPAHANVVELPLWTEASPLPSYPKRLLRAQYHLPLDRKIAVFGGQISEGRGINEMLAAAALAEKVRPDLFFLFIGDGRLVPLIEEHIASGASNILLKPRVPREEFLSLLSACDVGIVATIPELSVPTFPIKTMDYLRALLPVVAAVEQASELPTFLAQWNIGVSLPAGNAEALLAAISKLIDNRKVTDGFEQRARACLEEVFGVRRAVERIVAACGFTP
jgi:glycosyltransferase involved in cell wall biosynthesis